MLYQPSKNIVSLLGTNVPEPRTIIDFLGFETHVKQIRDKRGIQIWPGWYEHASYYMTDIQADKLFGPDEEVVIPSWVKAPDYEFEIALYVTERGMPKTEAEALKFIKEHCFVTILNDWSARDVQMKDMQGLGPSNSKFIIGNSIGPKLVKASELEMDENGLFKFDMILKVNGEERSRSNYQTLYHTNPNNNQKSAWSFPRLISWLANQNIAVEPGYLLGSGTVGNGCIAEHSAKMDPNTGKELEPAKLSWLKDGDVVTMEVPGIGVLENKVKIKELAVVK